MIDTLQKMSGTQHRSYTNSKTITKDIEKIWLRTEGKVSYTMTTVEEPVIKYNDMAFISERNSIVFRAGDSPIWNRNETILPMSWCLHKDTIKQPGHEYTFQTVPTLSSAKDFDVRKNVPNFEAMLEKRMTQALAAEDAQRAYKDAYEYTDHQIEQLDPDIYADDIMEMINKGLNADLREDFYDDDEEPPIDLAYAASLMTHVVPNKEQEEATRNAQHEYAQTHTRKYAGGALCVSDFKANGKFNHQFDELIVQAYKERQGDFEADALNFLVREGSLFSTSGTPYIVRNTSSADLERLNEEAKSEESNVYAEEDLDKGAIEKIGTYMVTDAFLAFLVSVDSWSFARGRFESEMERLINNG